MFPANRVDEGFLEGESQKPSRQAMADAVGGTPGNRFFPPIKLDAKFGQPGFRQFRTFPNSRLP